MILIFIVLKEINSFIEKIYNLIKGNFMKQFHKIANNRDYVQ
jgi:hypothetical protein